MSGDRRPTTIVPIYAGPPVTKDKEERLSKLIGKLGKIGTGGTFFLLGAFIASGALIRFAEAEMVILTLVAWLSPGAASAFGAVSTAATLYGWSRILRKKSKLNKKSEAKNEAQNQLANLLEFLGGFVSQGGAVASTVAVGAAVTVGSMTYLPEENVFGIEKPPVSIQRLKLSQLFESTEAVAAVHEQEMLEELAAADDAGSYEDEVSGIDDESGIDEIAIEDEVDDEDETDALVIDLTGDTARVIYNSQVFTDPAAIATLLKHVSVNIEPAVPTVDLPPDPRPLPPVVSRPVLSAPGSVSNVPSAVSEIKTADTSSLDVAAYVPAAVLPPVDAITAPPDTALLRPQIYQPEEAAVIQSTPVILKTKDQPKQRGILVSVRPELLVIMGETSTAGVTAEAGVVNDNGLFLTADIGGGNNYFGGGVNLGYAFIPFGDVKSVVGLSGGYHNTTVVHNLKSEDGTLLAREHGNKIGAGGVFVKLMPFKSLNLDITNRVMLGKSNLHRYDESTNDFKSEEGLSAAYSIGIGYSIMRRGQ